MFPSEEYQADIRKAREHLVSVYKYDCEHYNTPESTVALLVDEIGKDWAGEILAVMVLEKGRFDGRISRSSREWAEAYSLFDEDEIGCIHGCWYCDEIHPAHMEQLVSAFRKLYPV